MQDYLEIGIMAGAFALVAILAFFIFFRVAEKRRLASRLPSGATDSGVSLGGYPDLVLGDLTPGMQMPMSEEARSDLQRELLKAGFYRRTALLEYGAIRTLLTVAPLVGGGIMALMMDQSQMWTWIILGILGAMAGFSLPRIYLYLRGQNRQREIEKGLPVAVDMLTLCLSAGLNLQNSIRRVRRELRFSHPVLAQELEIVRLQAELRSLPLALQQFAERTQVPEVRNLATILIQSERLGTDTSAALIEYSNNLRVTMRQRADAQANRTMFWLLFPTLLCLWIPAGIILIGPAVLEFSQFRRTQIHDLRRSGFDEVKRFNSDQQQGMQRLNGPTGSPGATPGTNTDQ